MRRNARVLSIVIALCLLTSMAAQAAGLNIGIGTVNQATTTKLADLATLAQYKLQHNTAGVQSEQFIEWKYGSQLQPMVVGGPTIYGGSQTMSAAAQTLTARGYDVAAGMNGDFFTVATGVPMGMMVTDGVIRTSDAGFWAIGFPSNGAPFMAKPQLTTTLSYIANGSQQNYNIDHINKVRTAVGLFLYTPDFYSSTQTTTAGTHVILQSTDQLKIGQTITAQVVNVITGTAPATLQAGQFCLSVDVSGPINRISSMYAGMTVQIAISANESRFLNCSNVIGGYQPLILNGGLQSGLETTRAPRTAIGIRNDGTTIFYTVDGRQPNVSAGLGLDELALRMQALGCVWAVNMDGGGSTNMGATFPGDTTLSQLGIPSDGTPRKCANYVFLVNQTTRVNVPARIHVNPKSINVLLGTAQSGIQLTAKATDVNYHTVTAPTTISWSSGNNAIGTVSTSGLFIPSAAGTTTLTASAVGVPNAYATVDVNVVDKLDSIRLVDNATKKVVTALNLGVNQTIDLNAIGVLSGVDVVSSDASFFWMVTGTAATVSQSGVLTAGTQNGAVCYLVVGMGTQTQTIPVTIGKSPVVLADFDTVTPAFTPSTGALFAVDPERSNVRYGNNAGAFTYDFAINGSGAAAINYMANLPLNDQPSYINMWLKGDNSNNILSISLTDATGNPLDMTVATMNFTDYRYVSIPLMGITRINGFKLLRTPTGATTGTFYLDQMMAAFDTTQDTAAPTLTFTVQGGVDTGNLTISGIAQDTGGALLRKQDIDVQWDGTSIPFTFEQTTGQLTAVVAMPLEGYHRATVQVKDVSGNYARASYPFTQSTTLRASSFTDINTHWSLPFVEFMDRKNVYPNVAIGGQRPLGPDVAITRGEIAVLLSRALKLNEANWSNVQLPYIDVAQIPAGQLSAMKALYGVGIMRGTLMGDQLYANASQTLSRAEAFTMMGRAFPLGMSTSTVPLTFNDANSIPDYAKEHVKLMVGLQIASGFNGNFMPGNNITRAEMSKVLCGLY